MSALTSCHSETLERMFIFYYGIYSESVHLTDILVNVDAFSQISTTNDDHVIFPPQ